MTSSRKQFYILQSLLLLIVLAASPVHAGKLYKWTDSSGKVHYSETPPSQMADEESQGETDAEAAEKNDDVEIPTPTDLAASQQAAEKCQKLLTELAAYQDNQQITDEAGNPMVISPEMREAKINEINELLDQSCR